MLARWMRLALKVRPWMVAVSLAAGGATLAGVHCGEVDVRGDGDVDAETHCIPSSFYGPGPVCATDEDCRRQVGECSRCNGYESWSDGCGGSVTWRWCVPGYRGCDAADGDADVPDVDDVEAECIPAVFYGPGPVCMTDEDCQRAVGECSWCVGSESWPDGCGGSVTWRWCVTDYAGCAEADADADVPDVDDGADVGVETGLPDVEDADRDLGAGAEPDTTDDADPDSPAGWYGPPPCPAR